MQTFGLHRPLRRFTLLGPALGFLLVFLVGPLLLMAYVSFLQRGVNGGVDWQAYSPRAYTNFLFERDLSDRLIVNTDYLEIFLRSFMLSLSTTVIALVVGFPTALFMALQPPKRRNLMVFLVTIPFWTNLLIRNYAWILLLREGGPLASLMVWTGLFAEPPTMLYNNFSIAIGLTYSFLPFMVLPIYSSLEKIDFGLVEAGYDLYAGKLDVLKRVILPLSKPGILAGSILVFVPCLGAYITPVLLGGSKHLMIGNLIQEQFGASRNWPFGAALAFTLLSFVLLALMLQAWLHSKSEAKVKGS